MQSQAAERWDVFCRVVDNYGDVGVSWRLARPARARARQARAPVARRPHGAREAAPRDRPRASSCRTLEGVEVRAPATTPFPGAEWPTWWSRPSAAIRPKPTCWRWRARDAEAALDQPRIPERRGLGRGQPRAAVAATRACRSRSTSSSRGSRARTGGLLREAEPPRPPRRIPGRRGRAGGLLGVARGQRAARRRAEAEPLRLCGRAARGALLEPARSRGPCGCVAPRRRGRGDARTRDPPAIDRRNTHRAATARWRCSRSRSSPRTATTSCSGRAT